MDLHLPEEVDVAREDDLTVIVITRRTPMTIARLVAGLALALFAAQWMVSVDLDAPAWLVLGLFLGALGAWQGWSGLVHTLGKTTVYADDQAVLVTTGPLFVHRPVRVPMDRISGFRVDHHVAPVAEGDTRRQQVEALPKATWGPLLRWHVIAVLRDSEQAALVRGLPERRTAVATRILLQQHLERWNK